MNIRLEFVQNKTHGYEYKINQTKTQLGHIINYVKQAYVKAQISMLSKQG